MFNQWTGIGRLGKDPETRYTGSGVAVANFSIACDETWKDRTTGEKKQRTEWIRCVAWSKLAEIITKYCKKGQQVMVQGRIQTRKWQDRDNVTRYSTEIVLDTLKMLGSKPSGSSAPAEAADDFDQPGGERVEQPQQSSAPAQDFTDADMPF